MTYASPLNIASNVNSTLYSWILCERMVTRAYIEPSV